jgi:hypothetical protein
MVNARNGHHELINYYNVSWDIDQNMLSQTKHINQPTTMSIKQRYQKQSLNLYGIDDNMHPQKQKFEVSHENMILKPKHFHWRPMHNEKIIKFNDYSIFHFKRYSKQISYQQLHLRIRIHSSIFSLMAPS